MHSAVSLVYSIYDLVHQENDLGNQMYLGNLI